MSDKVVPIDSKKPQARTRKGGNGTGWGGPAKGENPPKERPAFDGTQPGPGRGHFSIDGESRKERNERLAEELQAHLHHLAFNADEQNIQLQAADRLLNRIAGKPIERVIQTSDPLSLMTTDELIAYREAIQAKEAATENP